MTQLFVLPLAEAAGLGAEARRWFEMAAEQGFEPAQQALESIG